MRQFTVKKLITGFILVLLLALVGGGALLAERLFHLDDYKGQILAEVEKSLGRRVIFEKGEFSFRFGPSFTFAGVVIKEKDTLADFITADRLTFKIAIIPLLGKKLVVRDLLLENPHIAIIRNPSGGFNISDLLEGKKETTALQIRGIRLKKATINFVDQAISVKGITTSLNDLDLSLDHLGRGKKTDIKLSAYLSDRGKDGVLTLSGTVKVADSTKPLAESILNLKLFVKNLDTSRYWPYYQGHVPFRQLLGVLDVDGTLKGKLAAFTSKGTMKIHGVRFDYPQIFHAVLTPRNINLKYDMELTPRDVLLKSLNLTIDGVSIKGSCAIREIDSNDPRITAQATTSRIRLEDFSGYVPYGIIVKDVAEYIEQHIKGGLYRLEEGRLDGRVSQILHMERGDNFNILYIKAHVEKGQLTYGRAVPTFNNIRGELEMRGKDFNLHQMSGNFGNSPMRLEGRITDYPLDKPSGYPFTMNMTPHQEEVAWLCNFLTIPRPDMNGESQLHLSGEGFTSGYNISGEWNLTPTAYSYPDLISKPAGRANSISVRGSINKQEAKITSLNYNLAPLAVTLTSTYRFTGKPSLSLDIKSNQFQLSDIATMLPYAIKYQAGGRLQAALHGERTESATTEMHWNGSVAFSGFNFRPSEQIKSVSAMTGTVAFNGTSLETSQLTAKIGNSTITGKGTLVGFKNSAFNLMFSSPSLDLADFGFHSPSKEFRTGRIQGELSFKEKELQVKSLTAQVNESIINLKGSVRDLPNPKFDLAVTSPHLDLADILLLASLEQSRIDGKGKPRIALKASIAAETAKIGSLDLAKLTSVIMYEDNILYLQPVECQILGGRLTGKGRADFSSASPRYQVGFNLNKVAAERFMKAMGAKKQELTGALSLQGELTAKGKDRSELEKTALGSIKLTCEQGTLRRFALLSKVFSILNVSQLLKFQLPDMVSGGMPYKLITATFSARDGIVSTTDLFLASNSLNISAVGKVDIAKNEVDATIGVQPLQTIDKVVSHIPIVGWLLTGDNKTLITAYFEAKGKLDDPTVNAIPVKSMAKGVLNVFKRLFELPSKLFTDTGEVIIGR